MKNKLLFGLAMLAMSLLGATGAQAQDQSQAQEQAQAQQAQQQSPEAQPSVARVSLMHGDVNTLRGDSGDWVAAALNAPIVAGDRVSTGTRSRLELALDFANFLRLDERTEAKIGNLTRTQIQVQIARGIVEYSVFKGNEADIEIDTPNVAIHPLREGRYRVQITADDQCEVMVREGEAEITTSQGSTRIHKGQMITVRGMDNPEFQTADATRTDSWDDWNKDRDRQVQDAASWSHANRYYTGVNDLDAYGHWTYIPGYGDLWVPEQSGDWAPYRDGRWAWEPYWGWTWVSYEPWGWAPYHYGRWFVSGGSWCWWPGPVYAGYRPFWGPAFVSFFGFSGRHWGMSVGFGFGGYGWLPIGPADPFYPWWGGFRRNLAVVNIMGMNNFRGGRRMEPLWNGRGRGFSNFRDGFGDERMRRGFTTMRADEFGRGGVRRDFQRVGAEDFRDGKMIAGGAPVVPTRESLRFSDRSASGGSMPARGGQERFFTRSTPRGSPESFQSGEAQMRDVVRQHGGNVGARGGAQAPAANGQPQQGGSQRFGGRSSAGQQGTQGQQERGRPVQGGQQGRSNAQPSASQPQQQGGWQRFGERSGAGQQGTQAQQERGRPAQGGQQGRSVERQRTETQPAGRNNAQPSASQPQQQGGWQRFPPSSGARPRFETPPRGGERQGQPDSSRSGGWQQQQQRQQQQQQQRYDSSRGNSRPPMNLGRPIMTPRSSPSGGYRSGSSGRSSAPPSYSRGSSGGASSRGSGPSGGQRSGGGSSRSSGGQGRRH